MNQRFKAILTVAAIACLVATPALAVSKVAAISAQQVDVGQWEGRIACANGRTTNFNAFFNSLREVGDFAEDFCSG